MTVKLDVTMHLEDLWRYARVLTRDDSDADDLVQEALTRALTLAHTFDDSQPILPWLLTIVRNTFFSGVIRANAEKRRAQKYAVLADPLLLPSQEHSVELSNVRRALLALPTEQAEVLHLVGVLGFSYSDTAEVLKVPIGTIMSRLSRARAALRQRMEGDSHSPQSHLKVVGGRNAP
jgi:RNA polymerase sigma factor (sigma-70 family)